MLATQPGLGAIVASRVTDPGRARVESDGRSDLVVIDSTEPPDAVAAGAEDLFVLLTTARSQPTAEATAAGLFDATVWQARLDEARAMGVRIGAATTFRVIVRVRSEKSYKRTQLRAAMTAQVLRWRPRWRVSDPGMLQLWVLETRPGQFRVAARVSPASMRQRGGRRFERPGSLRPAVAASMVAAAGLPRGTLLDPFCGSGTILSEARRGGWTAVGSDIDADAVGTAKENVPGTSVFRLDAAGLSFPDDSVAAIVTNPPFGKQHSPQTGSRSERDWWCLVLAEFARVTEPGASIVLLHPGGYDLDSAISQAGLRSEVVARIKTLGQRAVVWRLLPAAPGSARVR